MFALRVAWLLGCLFGSAATKTIIGTGQPGLGDEACKGLGFNLGFVYRAP